MKKIVLLLLSMQSFLIAQSDTVFKNIKRANRRANAQMIRKIATEFQARKLLEPQLTNGDQERYADKRGSYGKGLRQLDTGLVDPVAYASLVKAVTTWNPLDFNAIIMGTNPVEERLHSPQAGLDYNIFGADSPVYSMPAPPALGSAQKAGEMVEVYWMALMRDVGFDDYATDPTAADAIADLNNLSDFKGPKTGGSVTAQTLFRENFPGTLVGPYISQFLVKPVPFSDTDFIQQYGTPTTSDTNSFMTTFDEWFFIQQGHTPTRSITFGADTYIHNGRSLGNFVHKDPPQLPYIYAMLIILGYGQDALDQNNPYIGNPTQREFADFFKPQFTGLLCCAADAALRAAWYQKWIVNRTIRPEYYAFLVNQQITGAFDVGLNNDVIASQAVQSIFALNTTINGVGLGTYLLPQAFPEGCPLHPTYPAGHATVAGACVTMLKAFFNEDFIVPSPEVADSSGVLQPVSETLTVGGELNKLGANIAVGRNMAGVHYRSDSTESMILGEKVAISVLEDWSLTMNGPFKGFSLTKFDGSTIIVGKKKNVTQLP